MTENIEVEQPRTIRGNFVLLTAGALNLLLPQHEVGAAVYLDGVLEAGEQPGLLKLQGGVSRQRFAALSTQMTLLPVCPPDRFLVATLGDEGDDLGWCWNELKIMIDVELHPDAIPAVLLTPGTPVDQYVELNGKPAYLCNALRVRTFALASKIPSHGC